MTVRLLVGDVRDRIREIPDGSVDLVCCSPPFLALRKYGDNSAEMGSERTPADFLDALLELTQEFRRVLAPHGSIAIELGDTYSGSGGAGGDYGEGGLRDGQAKFRQRTDGGQYGNHRPPGSKSNGQTERPIKPTAGWPLAKSLTLIPTLYPASLAYGRNLLRGPLPASGLASLARLVYEGRPEVKAADVLDWLDAIAAKDENQGHTFPRWRVRNIIVWARPNPPVGALGDKVRPATSYITVACLSGKRFFDLDAVREPGPSMNRTGEKAGYANASGVDGVRGFARDCPTIVNHPAGAPPLDWWEDDDPTGHATLILPTQPYPGAHYATWPETLASRLIRMMCPLRVCTTCGKPSERIVGKAEYHQSPNAHRSGRRPGDVHSYPFGETQNQSHGLRDGAVTRVAPTIGWSDCGHNNTWRPGVVCDPFCGSGTTLAVAQGLARDAIGLELYPVNADLVRQRVGMFLEVA